MRIIFEHRLNAIQVYHSQAFYFPPHMHSEIEVMHVTSGTITLLNEGEKRQIHQGESAVIFSNNVHEYLPETHGEMDIMIVNASLIPEYRELFFNKFPTDFVIGANQHQPELQMIYRYLSQLEDGTDTPLNRAYVHLLFALIVEALTLQPRKTTASPTLESSIIKFVSENFTQPIALTDVAANVGCSEYTVSRIFSNKIKLGFSNYVNQLRVDYARKLLRDTELKTIDIATEAGFESLRTFNRAYKLNYAETPRDYRQRLLR